MRALFRFLKTTTLGGVFFLLPLVFLLFLLRQAFGMVRPFVAPIANVLPYENVGGMATATIVTACALLLVCVLAGVIAQTRLARYLSGSIEHSVERRIPLYRILRDIIRGMMSMDDSTGIYPVLARFDDTWQLGFVLEDHPDGLATVFVPQAPTPMVGEVYFMEHARLKRLNMTVGKAFRCIAQMGVGSRELLRGQFQPAAANLHSPKPDGIV